MMPFVSFESGVWIFSRTLPIGVRAIARCRYSRCSADRPRKLQSVGPPGGGGYGAMPRGFGGGGIGAEIGAAGVSDDCTAGIGDVMTAGGAASGEGGAGICAA